MENEKWKMKNVLKIGLRIFPVLLLLLLFSVTAEAHVKWFFDYDVSQPPTPIGEVIDGAFVKMFIVSVARVLSVFSRRPVYLRRRNLSGI